MTSKPLPEGYTLKVGYPAVDVYLDLRASTGLSLKSVAQATAAFRGSWHAVYILYEPRDEIVGMGRVIGDGGWYFHIADMAVLPRHQRKGLGDAILTALLKEIERRAPPGPYVNLVADEAGKKLYARHGFVETAPRSAAMEKRYGGPRH
jgi:ribosomal protein S18 acetylase RimI-like enzyme